MWRRRRAIRAAAAAAGFGRVLRIHRERNDSGAALGLWIVACLAVVPAAIASIVMATEESALWQWPLLAAFLGLLAAFGWSHLGPVHGGRRWVAVAEGGVVVWEPEGVTTLEWHRVGDVPTATFSGSMDLATAVDLRAPVPAWTWRRVAGLGAACLVAVAAVGFTAVPVLRYVLGVQAPSEIHHLARICDGGPGFDVPAYAGPGPHPVVVFEGGAAEYTSSDDRPEAVQLVACARRISAEPAATVERCEYYGGFVRELREARYRVEVYTARDGERVTSRVLRGDSPRGCADMIHTGPDEKPGSRPEYREPSPERYREQLAGLVGNRADMSGK
ncbi:hypothetical protein [Prauserella rugosa]|uniref:Uncharacterized protein n=1 Tax=Prauserella rugosa TaxID=43354 RepID=A0A660CGP1_9PSEU|nr:hypothetical protein [Prauserella rugosa]TWH20833.1 hypothetical protein JD82_02682 [Prauserella rugosa]